MQKVNHLPGKWWPNVVFSLIAVLVTVGDQLSKAWIRSNLALWQSLPETGFFRLIHLRNTGASFGLFRGYSFQLTIVAFFGVAVILFYAFFLSRRYPLLNNMVSKVALSLVLGGAIGNLIDRLRFGYVTDFFGVGAWPPFNVADSAITVGSAIFAGSLFYLFFRQSQETDGDEATSRKNSRFSK